MSKVIDVYNKVHPNARANGHILFHRLIASNTLGKALPEGVVIHHYGEESEHDKIVVCENERYHKFLHARIRALRVCGNAHWRKCSICKKYDSTDNLYHSKTGNNYRHVKCHNEYKLQLKK